MQSKNEDNLFAAFPDQDEPHSEVDEEWILKLEEKFEVVQKRKYDYERVQR